MMNEMYMLVSMLEQFKIEYTIKRLQDFPDVLSFYNTAGYYREGDELPDYDTHIEFSDNAYFMNRFYFKDGNYHNFGIYE